MTLDKNKKIKAIYDTGCTKSLINHKIVKDLKLKLNNSKVFLKSLGGLNSCKNRANVELKIGKLKKKVELIVVKNKNFTFDILIGLDLIKKFKLTQEKNLKIKQKLKEKKNLIKINLIKDKKDKISKKFTNKINVKVDNTTKLVEINLIQTGEENDEIIKQLNNLEMDVEDDKKMKIIKYLYNEKDAFAKHKFDVKQYEKTEAKIKLTEERIVNKRPYRCSLQDNKEIDKQIKKLIDNKLIEETYSPYSSPITLANKKGEGRTRLCVDFRELNKYVTPENHPFLRCSDILDNLRDCKYFTSLDVNSAFWSIKIKKEHRKYTAFSTQRNKFQWRVLPFGLKTSPAIFQRALNSILRNYKLQDFSVNYIDDVLVYSKTFEEHLEHVKAVMKALKENNMKLKLSKCKFFKESIVYLGHKISENQSQPLNDNIESIQKFPVPKTKKNIRQLLGKINH